jgi:hexulose-6-phosphate isomerase
MQGRLSPQVNGKIQAFPMDCWQAEFLSGHRNGFSLIEWTLDQDNLYSNPLLTPHGQHEIRQLCAQFDFSVLSLTGDCFMQSPFWKASSAQVDLLLQDFRAVAQASSAVGIQMMVVPLVDNGRIENSAQEDLLVGVLHRERPLLDYLKVKVVFESDFAPAELARFIGRLDSQHFGVNYDIGNSASLGFKPSEEIAAYGHRILNVHVKDRQLGGATVPLGTGNARFESVFAELAKAGYGGAYILQTARAVDGNHTEALCKYRDMTQNWMGKYGA